MAVSVMSRPPPVALAALMAPVATRASVLATALMASFVDRLGAHCRAFSSARRPASESRTRVTLSLSSTTRSQIAQTVCSMVAPENRGNLLFGTLLGHSRF
jgi:hypothetical protein